MIQILYKPIAIHLNAWMHFEGRARRSRINNDQMKDIIKAIEMITISFRTNNCQGTAMSRRCRKTVSRLAIELAPPEQKILVQRIKKAMSEGSLTEENRNRRNSAK